MTDVTAAQGEENVTGTIDPTAEEKNIGNDDTSRQGADVTFSGDDADVLTEDLSGNLDTVGVVADSEVVGQNKIG